MSAAGAYHTVMPSLRRQRTPLLLGLAAPATPAQVQEFLNAELYYNDDHASVDQEETAAPPRLVLRTGAAHCFEGAMFAYAVNHLHGHEPRLVMLEASQDADHNLTVCRDPSTGLYGANAQSRYPGLVGRPARYPTVRALAESYVPFYYSDRTLDPADLTLVGFSDPVDLVAKYGAGWIASNEPLWGGVKQVSCRWSWYGRATNASRSRRPATGAISTFPMWAGALIHPGASLETASRSATVLWHLARCASAATARAARAWSNKETGRFEQGVRRQSQLRVTREELVEAFGAVGRVVDAKVPTDRVTGRQRGFAFVEFENDEAVQKCIEQMNGRDLKGRAMRINAAEDRPPRPAGAPGGGFSRPGGGFSRPGGGGSGFSRPGGGGGGYSRPGGGFRPGAAPSFPPPEETGPDRGRRFKQKPETKPASKTSPRRRRDDIVDDDDADY